MAEGYKPNSASQCRHFEFGKAASQCRHFEFGEATSQVWRKHMNIFSTQTKWRTVLFMVLLTLFLPTGECHIREGEDPYNNMGLGEETRSPTPSPIFDSSHSSDVTALSGKTALLNCRVHNIWNKTVSWIRHRDIHLLTVGKYTYTSDQRFRAIHVDDTDDWTLKINYAQKRDSGRYECQVSTTPPMSHFVTLDVVQPLTEILGGGEMYLNRGSTINLTCVVQYAPDPPDFIYWKHNDQIISYDSERGGVTVIIEKGDVSTSSLLIQNAASADSGRYQCQPSNAVAAAVTVYVLNGGEYPAAIQQGSQSTYSSSCFKIIVLLLIFLTVYEEEFL